MSTPVKFFFTFLGIMLIFLGPFLRAYVGILPRDAGDFTLAGLLLLFFFSVFGFFLHWKRMVSPGSGGFLSSLWAPWQRSLELILAQVHGSLGLAGIMASAPWRPWIWKILEFHGQGLRELDSHYKGYWSIFLFLPLLPPLLLLGEYFLLGRVYLFYFSLFPLTLIPFLHLFLQSLDDFVRDQLSSLEIIFEVSPRPPGYLLTPREKAKALPEEYLAQLRGNWKTLRNFSWELLYFRGWLGYYSLRFSLLRSFLYLLGWLQILGHHPLWENFSDPYLPF